MRRIELTSGFRRDFKKLKASGRHRDIDTQLGSVLELLCEDTPLPRASFDHALTGQWSDHRDCHIKPDWVLIYRKPDPTVLQLVRLGSHSELGL